MQSEDGINVNKRECGTFYMIIIPPCKVEPWLRLTFGRQIQILQVTSAVYIIDHTLINTVQHIVTIGNHRLDDLTLNRDTGITRNQTRTLTSRPPFGQCASTQLCTWTKMNNVLSMPYLNNGVYPSPPISDPSLSRQYDYIQDRDGFYDPPLSGEMLDNDFEGLDDRDKMRGGSFGL
jgi:hypothetical protein